MKAAIQNITIIGSLALLISGCSNLQHQSAMNVWGGLPVKPICQNGAIDWTKLQKNEGYFTKFQEYGVRLKEDDFLRYKNKGKETTARIRMTKKDEYNNFSGYVINYTERTNDGAIEYNIPITANLEYEKIAIEMCGGANVHHASICADEKQRIENELEIYFYNSSEGGRSSVLSLYRNGLFPGSGGNFTNNGRTYINVFSKTSFQCDLINDYRDFEKKLYEKNIPCYSRTGDFCRK